MIEKKIYRTAHIYITAFHAHFVRRDCRVRRECCFSEKIAFQVYSDGEFGLWPLYSGERFRASWPSWSSFLRTDFFLQTQTDDSTRADDVTVSILLNL